MKNTAFLFSGQGAQYIGMGKDLYENFAEFKYIFDSACEYLKINLKNICFDGELEELSKTQNLQPAIVIISYGIYKLLEKENIIPSAVAGFSLGEISAFASLGILSFEDTLNLVKVRGAAMEKACEYTKGAMYSIIGLDDATVKEVCADCGGYVVPANYNCPGQTVISGEAEAVERAAKVLADKGARTVKLNVSGAFHSKLMKQGYGEDAFREFLSSLDFKNAPSGIDCYSNVSGDKLSLSEDKITLADLKLFMINYIPEQMSSPVRFREELENMERDGIDNFIETGVGKVLTGFVKRTAKSSKFTYVDNCKTFEQCLRKFI